MGVQKQIALTMALCKLHDFCIDGNEQDILSNLPSPRPSYALSTLDQDIPLDLVGSGEHFDDLTEDDLKDLRKSKVWFEMRQNLLVE